MTLPALFKGMRRTRDITKNKKAKVRALAVEIIPAGNARRGWFRRSDSRSRISLIRLPNPQTKKAAAMTKGFAENSRHEGVKNCPVAAASAAIRQLGNRIRVTYAMNNPTVHSIKKCNRGQY
jgi:hypothetical protein